MKKIILILGMIIITLIETKAQQQNQFITDENYASLKSMYSSCNNLPIKDYAFFLGMIMSIHTAALFTVSTCLAFYIGLISASNSTSIDTDATAALLYIIGLIMTIPFGK